MPALWRKLARFLCQQNCGLTRRHLLVTWHVWWGMGGALSCAAPVWPATHGNTETSGRMEWLAEEMSDDIECFAEEPCDQIPSLAEETCERTERFGRRDIWQGGTERTGVAERTSEKLARFAEGASVEDCLFAQRNVKFQKSEARVNSVRFRSSSVLLVQECGTEVLGRGLNV